MQLKLGKHEYVITEKDVFLDNSACVMLWTQSKEKLKPFSRKRPTPSVSKKVQKQIEPYKEVIKIEGCFIWFKLNLKKDVKNGCTVQ